MDTKDVRVKIVDSVLSEVEKHNAGELSIPIHYLQCVFKKINAKIYYDREEELEALYFAAIGFGVLA